MTIGHFVTFEFDTRLPMTHRGTIAAAQASTCFARAIRAAQKVLRPSGWSSVVCVLDRHATVLPSPHTES
jgi:hypothetical protein